MSHTIAQNACQIFALRHVKRHQRPKTGGVVCMKALFWGQRRLRWPFPEGEELLKAQQLGQSSPSFQAARPAVGTALTSQNQQDGSRKVA